MAMKKETPTEILKLMMHQVAFWDGNGFPGIANALLRQRDVDFNLIRNKDVSVTITSGGSMHALSLVDAPPEAGPGDTYLVDGR